MTPILMFINALIAVAMIILILLQRSDPASGGAFGGMGGTGGPAIRNPLAKPTAVLAAIFLVNSLVVAYLSKGATSHTSIMEETAAPGTALPAPSLDFATTPVSTTNVTPTIVPVEPVSPTTGQQ